MFNNLTYLAHPRSQWGKSWLITQHQLKSWLTEASLHLDLHWWNDRWVLGDLFPDLDYGIIQLLDSLWWMQRGDQWDSGVENGQASVALIHGALTPLATRWPHGGCFWQGRNIHVSSRLEVKLMGLWRSSSCSSSHKRADKGLASVCLPSHRPLLHPWRTGLPLHIFLMPWMLGCETQQTFWLQLVCVQHPGGAALPEQLLSNADTAACCRQWRRR